MISFGDLIEAIDDYREAEKNYNVPYSMKDHYYNLMADAAGRGEDALRSILGLEEE